MKEFFIVITLIGFALFLILLVLVQRGRGGGLAGALGGAGGQSAFGAKAGDTFTKITMWTAFFWIVFCVIAVRLMTGSIEPDFSSTLGGAAKTESGQSSSLTGQKQDQDAAATGSTPSDAPGAESNAATTAPASSTSTTSAPKTGETDREEATPAVPDSGGQ
ncbi:MAG: preprotein translocase subunit SecG [Planctomycetaceae bacterium]|nr:preprotein translocase subunit SecG [Planctomycetaceae bacterium]